MYMMESWSHFGLHFLMLKDVGLLFKCFSAIRHYYLKNFLFISVHYFNWNIWFVDVYFLTFFKYYGYQLSARCRLGKNPFQYKDCSFVLLMISFVSQKIIIFMSFYFINFWVYTTCMITGLLRKLSPLGLEFCSTW